MMFIRKRIKHPKINILLPFKDQLNYLTITLSTLKEAIKRYPNCQIFLYNTNQNSNLPDLAKELPVNFNVTKKFKSIEIMYYTIIPQVFNRINEDFLMIIEGDAVVHPDTLIAASQMLTDLPDMGFGSVFNTPFHPAIKRIGSKYVKKENLGFLGSIIKRDLWKEVKVRGVHKSVRIPVDSSYARHVAKKKLGIYCTNKSYIEHIGFSGKHIRKMDCPHIKSCLATIDRAINFWE